MSLNFSGLRANASPNDLKLLYQRDAQGLALMSPFLAALFACVPSVEHKRDDDAGKAKYSNEQSLELLNPGP